MKGLSKTVTVLVFVFLYIPMLVLMVASFNTGSDMVVFKGFTWGTTTPSSRTGSCCPSC